MTKHFKARKTVYKNIEMRSRLEAGFAMWLDQYELEWEYEPHAYASERGQYLPDFEVKNVLCSWIGRPVDAIIEVKPAGLLTLDVIDKVCAQFDIVSFQKPDALLILATNTPTQPFSVYTDRFGWLIPPPWDNTLRLGLWPHIPRFDARTGMLWLEPNWEKFAEIAPGRHQSEAEPWQDGYWNAT